MLVLIIVDSIEVCIGKRLNVKTDALSTDLYSTLVEIIRIFSQNLYSFGNLNFSFSQEIEARRLVSFSIHKLSFFYLDQLELLDQQFKGRVIKGIKNRYFSKHLNDIILLRVVE